MVFTMIPDGRSQNKKVSITNNAQIFQTSIFTFNDVAEK